MRKREYRATQRREERQHELTMMRQIILLATTLNAALNIIPTAFQWSSYPIAPGPNSENMHCIGGSTSTNRRDDTDYFELIRHLGDNIISLIHALKIL